MAGLSEERLAEIRKRVDAATPGPWEHDLDPDSDWFKTTMGCGSVYTMGEDVMGGNIAAPNGDCYPRSGYAPKEDMSFIAHARTDVPDLLAEVDRLKRFIAAYIYPTP